MKEHMDLGEYGDISGFVGEMAERNEIDIYAH